ncbi:MAG: PEP-CTERM sorting domain-containing protein [Planctomycetota bacterium]
MMKKTTLSALALTLAAGTSQAAAISWGTATDVSTGIGNSSDVSTVGTLVEAYNAVSGDPTVNTTDQTVNGVLFVATGDLLDNGGTATTDLSPSTNGGDPEYDALVSRPDFGNGTDLVTLTLGEGDGNGTADGGGDLIIGREYLIQIWYVDEVFDDRVTPVGDGNGNTVDLNDQFVIGTFTADGDTQDITLASPGFGNAHITAYQIREVPEPGSLALFGLGGLLIARRRRV